MKIDRPIYFYVANLGSEVQRILSWKERGDKEAMRNAYNRSISIIQTIKSFNKKNANIEMGILEECLSNFIVGKDTLITRNQISSYFNPFALRITNNL